MCASSSSTDHEAVLCASSFSMNHDTLVLLCGRSDAVVLDTAAKVVECVCKHARANGFVCGAFRSGGRDCVRVFYSREGVRKFYRFDVTADMVRGVRKGYMVVCSDKGFRVAEHIDAYATEQRCLRQVATLFRRADELSGCTR